MTDGPIVLGRRSLHWLRPYWRLDLPILASILVEVSYWTFVPLALRLLIDGATEGRDAAYLARILVLLGFGFVVSASVSTARMALTARVGARLLVDARLRLFEHLQRLPPRFFGRVHSGELVARFTTDLNTIESAFTFGVPEVVWGVVQIAIAVPLLYLLNVGMAIVATVSVPLALAGPRVLAGPVETSGYRRRHAEGQLQAAAEEQIAGQSVVHAFGLEQYMLQRLSRQLAELGTLTAQDTFLTRLVGRTTVYGAHLGQLVLYAVGVVLIYRGELTVGTFVGFVGLLLNVGEAIRSLSVGLPAWFQAAGPLRRSDELLAEPLSPGDPPQARPLAAVRGGIQLRGVSFSHDGRRPALIDLSLTIPAASRVAIVGASGSGKSTLLGLLMRSLDPDRGVVLLDGQDARGATRASWQAQLGVVPAETFLFTGTVAENIRLGRPDASDDEVQAAARAAQIHAFLAGLPDGYASQVGERGASLSTGQRQRIALARAVLRRPAILLLDEATSALDPRTEADFNVALDGLAHGRTVVSVTHRLGAAVDADRIFVLRDGRLVQLGSHAELLADPGGEYARLWAHQHGFGLRGDGESARADVRPERLREIPLFSTVSTPVLERLASQFLTRHVPSGQVVVTQGEPADNFYLIVRGSVDVVFVEPSGGEHVLATLEDGDAFGEIALLERGRRMATVRTRTDCVLLSLAGEHFERLLALAPELEVAIRDLAAARAADTRALLRA
jgi:ATP-binding cassette subfamily B protein